MRNMSLLLIEEKKISQDNLTQSDIDYFKKKYGKKFVRALRVVEEKFRCRDESEQNGPVDGY